MEAYLLGYQIGRRVEMERWSALADDARTATALPRGDREERVRERVVQAEACAERTASAMGRVYRGHPGGPVDWVTGEPVHEHGGNNYDH